MDLSSSSLQIQTGSKVASYQQTMCSLTPDDVSNKLGRKCWRDLNTRPFPGWDISDCESPKGVASAGQPVDSTREVAPICVPNVDVALVKDGEVILEVAWDWGGIKWEVTRQDWCVLVKMNCMCSDPATSSPFICPTWISQRSAKDLL